MISENHSTRKGFHVLGSHNLSIMEEEPITLSSGIPTIAIFGIDPHACGVTKDWLPIIYRNLFPEWRWFAYLRRVWVFEVLL